ncbi:hypothetical protein EYS14_11035 [Alteromonadaceae bacterium M269]|nr:hypothetical protein EYS14_11035 [Alteromonadaceae bacterium M269]
MGFVETLIEKAKSVATLKIVTAVGNAKAQAGDSSALEPADNAKVMYSSINLLEGDITTIIPDEFTQPPLSSLRQFHQTREDMGRQIIRENIACLKELVDLIRHAENK